VAEHLPQSSDPLSDFASLNLGLHRAARRSTYTLNNGAHSDVYFDVTDSLVSTTPPEAIVKAQLMAASELLMDQSAPSNCQPSQTVRDLLYGT
jgi:hypothetical protein